MNFKTILKSIAICGICCACSAQAADDTKFGDWTVSINPAEADSASDRGVTKEVIFREVHEVRHVRTQCNGPRYPYGYRGSDYSIYFPWRNTRSLGFTSYYRPRTIYNYGY